MVEIHVYADPIDHIRDLFSAEPESAARLRALASEKFWAPVAAQRSTSLLSRLGPLFRREPWTPPLPTDMPTPNDVEALVSGQYVAPERLEHAWRVVHLWLDETTLGHIVISLTSQQLENLEFDLARAGVPSQYSLQRLGSQDAAIPLRALPGMTVGYAKNQHVLATRDALHANFERLDAADRPVIEPLLNLLDEFDQWGRDAATAGGPPPDIFMVTYR